MVAATFKNIAETSTRTGWSDCLFHETKRDVAAAGSPLFVEYTKAQDGKSPCSHLMKEEEEYSTVIVPGMKLFSSLAG